MHEWEEKSARLPSDENMKALQNHMIDIFFDLAVARILQVDREIDVELFRAAIGGKASCNTKFRGKITPYRKSEAVEGEVAGKDESGYPYKRWKLIEPELAREILKRRRIRPLKSGAIEVIQKLDRR